MNWKKQRILVTGGAGFIGSHLAKKLVSLGAQVTILDNFHSYYSPAQKRTNTKFCQTAQNCHLIEGSILNPSILNQVFKQPYEVVIHLAAQAGVRASLKNPLDYYRTNIFGTAQILERIRQHPTQFIFASSSSVYGNNPTPFKEDQIVNQQISPYATSKKIAELICQNYALVYQINTTILRLFTVYGPQGRPDMAPYKFIQAALNHLPIKKFGDGLTQRDYTFIDDVVDGFIAAIERPFEFEIINLGKGAPISLNDFITQIKNIIQQKIDIQHFSQPEGDVDITFADHHKARKLLNWEAKTPLNVGLEKTLKWFNNK